MMRSLKRNECVRIVVVEQLISVGSIKQKRIVVVVTGVRDRIHDLISK